MPSSLGKVLSEAKRMRGAAKRQLHQVSSALRATLIRHGFRRATFPGGEGLGSCRAS